MIWQRRNKKKKGSIYWTIPFHTTVNWWEINLYPIISQFPLSNITQTVTIFVKEVHNKPQPSLSPSLFFSFFLLSSDFFFFFFFNILKYVNQTHVGIADVLIVIQLRTIDPIGVTFKQHKVTSPKLCRISVKKITSAEIRYLNGICIFEHSLLVQLASYSIIVMCCSRKPFVSQMWILIFRDFREPQRR